MNSRRSQSLGNPRIERIRTQILSFINRKSHLTPRLVIDYRNINEYNIDRKYKKKRHHSI